VGAPDFALMRDGIVIGHCVAKDLHIDLKAMKEANLAQKGPRHCPRYPRRMGDAYLRSNGLE